MTSLTGANLTGASLIVAALTSLGLIDSGPILPVCSAAHSTGFWRARLCATPSILGAGGTGFPLIPHNLRLALIFSAAEDSARYLCPVLVADGRQHKCGRFYARTSKGPEDCSSGPNSAFCHRPGPAPLGKVRPTRGCAVRP